LNLIRYYGGSEIRIPTSEEISSLLKYLLLYQYYKVEELSWKESLLKSGFSLEESQTAKANLQVLSKTIENQDLGKRNYE
jgi:hypothetical protein